MNTSKRGFTLVELLVVIGIIALLISILLPTLNKAREAGVKIKCAAQMKQLIAACHMYANDYKGFLPPVAYGMAANGSYGRPTIFPQGAVASEPAPTLLGRYLGKDSSKLYTCPKFQGDVGYNPDINFSYRYNQWIGGDDYQGATFGTNGGSGSSGKSGTTPNVVPWKMAQIKASSNMSLFIEGQLSTASNSPGRTTMCYAIDIVTNYPAYPLPTGVTYHALSNKRALKNALHDFKSNGTYVDGTGATVPSCYGNTNVAFCDGSVRTVRADMDSAPFKAWEGVYIDPFHPYPTWTTR